MPSTLSAKESPHLVVPPMMYAVPGVSLSLHLHDALQNGPASGESLKVACPVGETDKGGVWNLSPGEAQVGDHPWVLRWENADGETLGVASSVIRVCSAEAGSQRPLTLLLVGDSLTDMTLYPNELGRLLRQPGNPDWRMLGLNRPETADPGVAHEGYGGWTWRSFNTQHIPGKPPGNSQGSSPFLFPDDSTGKPALDISRYLKEGSGGSQPDLVVFFLGINDCFFTDPNDPAAIEAQFENMVAQAEILLAAFRKALPEADFGLCLTPKSNMRESAFRANYDGKYTPEGWRHIQYRLVERQLAQFGNREDEKIHIIPLSLVMNPESGYPPDDAVHPNVKGSQAIGANIYAWIKNRLWVYDNEEKR